ncbi:MAG TPA: 2-acylglycerophosphoethanolamine acyltransferase, partial [Rhodobacteraceae bacterium]|nr:2-acylglycerophosphoethanolamine acyltransferase [Paracoccaceae bacterium]
MPSQPDTPEPDAPKFDPAACRNTLFGALLQAARTHGGGKEILEDIERQPMSYNRLILASLVLGGKLAAMSRRGEAVGVLLPNVAGLCAVIFGLNAYGRVPAMLNFSAGAKNLSSALTTGVISTVITSRRFIKTAGLEDVIAALEQTEGVAGKKTTIIYLEDVRKRIGVKDKVAGLVKSRLAASVHKRHGSGPDDPAVILFTSGTEGAPKGVVLSNANLVANAGQIFAHTKGRFTTEDVVLNPLPMFHSFGLTAGTLMPLLNGMKVVLYPSPLHYKEVPKLIGATQATIVFGTDSFAQGYARAGAPGDLDSVRYMVCGAEKVKDKTRKLWATTGTMLLEGYGATECAPVVACNTPDACKEGTVGPVLPGIELRVEPVPGINEGGQLFVKGPNVMCGYMFASAPGKIVPP